MLWQHTYLNSHFFWIRVRQGRKAAANDVDVRAQVTVRNAGSLPSKPLNRTMTDSRQPITEEQHLKIFFLKQLEDTVD